jgi:hypothetical protein
MHPTDLAGLGGVAISAAALALLLPGVSRLGRGSRATLFVLALLLLALPYDGLAMVAYVRGVTGDLSVTTLVLALAAIVGALSGRRPFEADNYRRLWAAVALSAVFLYPLALGAGSFDPYRLGYGDPWLVTTLALLALWSWWTRLELLSICLALALLAWAVGCYESTNLWDYLLDPLLAIYAIASILMAICKRMMSLLRARRAR